MSLKDMGAGVLSKKMPLDFLVNFFRGRSGVQDPEALGLPPGQKQIPLSDFLVKVQSFFFKAGLPQALGGPLDPFPGPRQADSDRAVQQKGQIRDQGIQYQGAQLFQGLQVQSPGPALVNEGGIPETVADHPIPPVEGRLDFFGHMLAAVGQVEKQFRFRLNAFIALIQQNRSDLFSDGRSSRFPGHQAKQAPLFQVLSQPPNLGGFAGTFYSFKGDKQNLRFLIQLYFRNKPSCLAGTHEALKSKRQASRLVILSETKDLVFQLKAYRGDSSVASLLQNDKED
jgi:hypothetical protein